MNKNQKIFGAIVLVGISGIILYKKMNKPAASATKSTAPTTNTGSASFTGNDGIYSNYTGYFDADGTSSDKCTQLMGALMKVREQLKNKDSMASYQVTGAINNEMFILAELQKLGCTQ